MTSSGQRHSPRPTPVYRRPTVSRGTLSSPRHLEQQTVHPSTAVPGAGLSQPPALPKQCPARLSFGEAMRSPLGIFDLRMGVDSQQGIHGGEQIIWTQWIRRRISCQLVRRAVGPSPANPATGQHQAVTLWPVVAATILVDSRGTAKLAHQDN